MKFSLNLLFFFSSSRKKWKSGKGGESEGEMEERGGGRTDTFFSLPTSLNAKK